MRVENVCGPAPAGGTRRHHEADEQLSGTEAQHPSQPVPATHDIKVLIFQPYMNGDGINNGVFPAADEEILHEWMVKGRFQSPERMKAFP